VGVWICLQKIPGVEYLHASGVKIGYVASYNGYVMCECGRGNERISNNGARCDKILSAQYGRGALAGTKMAVYCPDARLARVS
jgi:hypothetical protein